MASGGARMGAGRKARSLEKKIVEGKSAKFIPMKDLSDVKCDVPKADKFLTQKTKDGVEINAEQIYSNVYKWLHTVGCEKLVPDELITKYSWIYARWRYCETCIMSDGEVQKCDANGGKMVNPLQKYAEMYSKQMDAVWMQIYTIVKENASEEFNNMSDDPMEKMLRGKAK